ncbi:hypothetical protein JTB14_034535 [Gonioctena quinquepunctata]|nr:hypothetical protein JTB14_034535 [Gonioctena quinquepunctata]
MSSANSNRKTVDSNLVDKILEQGQKLRNAMVASILKNDPLSTKLIYNNPFNTPQSSKTEFGEPEKVDNLISLEAFIKGECMTKEDEKTALDTLRSLSGPDLCKTTEKSLKSNNIREYKLPDSLVGNVKPKSKVDSGLENGQTRLCSRQTNNVINFKQVAIHEIKSLDKVNLGNCDIQFRVSFRNCKQKNAVLLGFAKFNFEEFLFTKSLSCSRGLVVFLNESSPISVGILKLSLQLGCGRLYFGQEFIDALVSTNKDPVVLDSDDSTNQLISEQRPAKKYENDNTLGKQTEQFVLDVPKHPPKVSSNAHSQRHIVVKKSPKNADKHVLFSFLYISEAQYLNRPVNSFFTCQLFCQPGTSASQVITNSSNPIFNFHQSIPLIFGDDLLLSLRENYMIIEFWEKSESSSTVFGITKIPLHQFYLAYRNSVILKYLVKNRLPVIGTDWWEPIYSPDEEDLKGQVQILTAIGTEEQIQNLKSDRDFPSKFVKANFPNPKNQISTSQVHLPNKQKTKFRKFSPHPQSTNTSLSPLKQLDAATQSEVNMEKNENPDKNNPLQNILDVNMEKNDGSSEKNNLTQDMLGSFLSQLMKERLRNVCVENSTNTETVPEKHTSNSQLEQAQSKTNTDLRRTTDLLDSLQKALSLESNTNNTTKIFSKVAESFKANIALNSANHLPCRKKMKSKKTRGRAVKNEDSILPSCYVTFKTSEEDLKFTPVISKTSSPAWNYKCDVKLPLDLLTNSQKRLIFKVWKKSTNAVNVPNMLTDSVVGFAALDLTVLMAGLPSVQGWFNIIDFTGKCNGQINIHVTPLEDLSKYRSQKNCGHNARPSGPNNETSEVSAPDETSESLSRVLKRKFSELDEITQRLRLRLSKVTNEDSDTSSDGFAENFERDINTLCIEEDFDLIDFNEEAKKLNVGQNVGDEKKVESSDCDSQSLLQFVVDEEDLMVVEEGRDKSRSSLESSSEISAEKSVVGKNSQGEIEGGSLASGETSTVDDDLLF